MSESVFFDLLREITTNPVFINKVQAVMHDMELAAESGEDDAFRYHMLQLLRLCDYNASLLVPYFFPKFPDDAPMTLWERPHAISMMSFIPNGTLTVQASRQIGKCLAGDTVITIKLNGVEGTMTLEELFKKSLNDNKNGLEEKKLIG